MNKLKLLWFGLLLQPLLLVAQPVAKKQGGYVVIDQIPTYMSYRQMAQRLVKDYPNVDPMVMTHARSLVSGGPVKNWKNCLLEDTLQAELYK